MNTQPAVGTQLRQQGRLSGTVLAEDEQQVVSGDERLLDVCQLLGCGVISEVIAIGRVFCKWLLSQLQRV